MPDSPVTVVLLATDLMLSSTVSGYAAAAGASFKAAATAAEAADHVASAEHVLLLVDLGCAGLDVSALAAMIPEQILRNAVAYGPHVHVQKLQAATDAGFGQVMSRGQFSAQAGQLISASIR